MFRPFHETADPLKQPCLIRMAADALYLFYMGFDFYRFTKQLYFFSSLDNTAAQCALPPDIRQREWCIPVSRDYASDGV